MLSRQNSRQPGRDLGIRPWWVCGVGRLGWGWIGGMIATLQRVEVLISRCH